MSRTPSQNGKGDAESTVIVENKDLTGTTPRIRAAIIGDTTCGISLLTDTIHGSKFAIPSTQIHPAGTGRIFAVAVKRA